MSEQEQVERLRAEVARLNAELEAEREHAAQWREVAEERRVTLERFRQHPAVRLVFWFASILLPPLRRLRRRAGKVEHRARKVAAGARGVPHRLTAARREQELEAAVAALPDPPADGRKVSVIVLTRDGREHLERLLPALRERTAHEHLEILVADNASDAPTREFLASQDDVRVLRNDTNLSFAEANNRAAAATSGDVLCFLNDDVEPLSHGWLPRLLARLDGDDVAAFGAQLVYPRRPIVATTKTRDVGVQHLGIEFVPTAGGVPKAVNVGDGADPDPFREPYEVAAATAACLAVDRQAFDAVGGFHEGYVYGAEDVDLCWRLRRAGHRIGVAPDAVLYHHEGATRHRVEDPAALNERQERNWDRFAQRFGPEVTRAVTLDRLLGERRLSRRPYELAITITRDLPEAGYGDWYTAHELGDELAALGLRVRYVERYRDAWYDLPDTVDAVVCLLDTFDVREVARPGLTTIAWVRNWTERWATMPWFGDFDVVLASSQRSADVLRERTRHHPVVFPLATNPARFVVDGAGDAEGGAGDAEGGAPQTRERVVFTGNYWGRDTRVDELAAAVPDLQIYGKGWDERPEVIRNWQGALAYDDLPALYRESAVVVDQAAQHTKDSGSLNSRVFDALACGALPVTNQVDGARELFGDRLPTYTTPEELANLVRGIQRDPDAARRLVEDLRDDVLVHHTYAARALRLRDLLADRAAAPSFVLKVSAPDRDAARTWGDWHLAEALARELRAAGHPTALQTADEWDDRDGFAADVAVHLKGRSRPVRAPGQVHVVWNISHPEELTPEECDDADLVLVASRAFPDELRTRTSTPVGTLLQATDERRFRPLPPAPEHHHEVAFVGNSRFTMRPVVRDAIDAGLKPAIYGANWEKYVDPDLVVTTFVPNEDLAEVYSSVDVLLNDHWEGMRRHGFVSNRIFDALACGAAIVSDDVAELRGLFGDGVAVYDGTPDGLRRVVDGLLGDADRRRSMGARGRDIVLTGHTFGHRASELVAAVRGFVEERRPPRDAAFPVRTGAVEGRVEE